MNPLTLDALRKTIRKTISGNRGQPERKSMKVYIVQRESLVGNEVDCFTDPTLAAEWAMIVRSHVQIEETMDERLPEFIETYKRLPVIAAVCKCQTGPEWNGSPNPDNPDNEWLCDDCGRVISAIDRSEAEGRN